MWVARDENEALYFFSNKPKRHDDGYWVSIPYGEQCMLGDYMFPELKWEDEPLEVTIVPTSFIKEVNNLTDAICGSELGVPENKEKGDVLVAMKKVNEQIKDICG